MSGHDHTHDHDHTHGHDEADRPRVSSLLRPGRFRPNAVVRSLRWGAGKGEGPRVHIEDDDPERYRNVAQALGDAGFQIGPFCGGPHFNATGPGTFRCPFVDTGECNAVEDADLILFRYGLESPESVALLDSLLHGGRPRHVVVETSARSAASHTLLLEGCRVLEAPATVSDIVDAVRAELRDASA